MRTRQVDYHRNGISGEPFYIVHFDDAEHGAMMAVVFMPEEGEREQFHNPRVAVFQESQLPSTTFGENSWRADHYHEALYEAIDAHDAEERARLLGEGGER